ncbi:baeRF3 domain-containing protein [Anabaena sp. WFMT]|uniref:baeRF3 domain-containing protein n=1 Tax=Anabaena sp. WFMT TaxID=3449730 RepID=UPI003F2497AD
MTLLSIDELKTLVANPETPCISLYMPMQKAGPEIRQNPIRFKNLIREAEERLDAIGIRHTEALNLLKPATELDQDDFWEHQDQGLVIFISPNLFRYYCLPIEFSELVVVGEQFHLKPLLHLINNDGSFYVLALSQKDVKLFAGTAHSLNEVQVENIPHRLAETLLEDELQKGVQHRIGTPRGATASAQHPGSVHGQGSPDREKHEEDILQFCYAIDTALHEKLREEKAPLVLAGVEYLFPIYQEANTYPHLLAESINGNPEIINLEQLHDEAWRIVAPSFQEEKKAAIELYQQFAGEDNGKATSDIKEIIPAAYYQRVDSLFVSVDEQKWGKFDSETSSVDLHAEPEPDDEDMLDCAAVHTLLNGGRVYTLESQEMPHGATAAAIFRY